MIFLEDSDEFWQLSSRATLYSQKLSWKLNWNKFGRFNHIILKLPFPFKQGAGVWIKLGYLGYHLKRSNSWIFLWLFQEMLFWSVLTFNLPWFCRHWDIDRDLTRNPKTILSFELRYQSQWTFNAWSSYWNI